MYSDYQLQRRYVDRIELLCWLTVARQLRADTSEACIFRQSWLKKIVSNVDTATVVRCSDRLRRDVRFATGH
ncbi:MAG: hypothetical protein ACI89J_003197 [Hyphomicrobiaceae bacterium]|jgi:hypothetical protein